MFKALMLEKDDAGFRATVRGVDEAGLPEGDVTVRVEYSTLNYKDALAITNRSPIVRSWPMVAGIDGAGTVLASSHPAWKAGDAIVHNGWGVGETRWGCLAERARLKGDWLVALPAAFSARQAMAIGTAGYTAMLCVLALERHGVAPGDGEVLVTGATGGVGSVAIALLARPRPSRRRGDRQGRRRPRTCASSAPPRSIDRAELGAPGKPLQKERWAAVDRRGRQPHARQRAGADALRRRRRRLRPGAGPRPAGHGDAVHPARRDAGRHRQRDGAARPAPGGLGGAWRAISMPACSTSSPRRCRSTTRSPRPSALLEGGVRGRVVVRI